MTERVTQRSVARRVLVLAFGGGCHYGGRSPLLALWPFEPERGGERGVAGREERPLLLSLRCHVAPKYHHAPLFAPESRTLRAVICRIFSWLCGTSWFGQVHAGILTPCVGVISTLRIRLDWCTDVPLFPY
jgi:hypothetical protein